MIRPVACGLFALLTADGLLAEPLVVRSGDHGSFTRLTVGLPSGTDWTLEQVGDEAELHLDRPATTFDVSEVFSRIGRNRLHQVTQAAPGEPLELELTCKCVVRAFEEGDKLLVLDIREGQPPVAKPADLPVVFGPSSGSREINLASPHPLNLAPPPFRSPPTPTAEIMGIAIKSQLERAIAQGLLSPTADHRASTGPDRVRSLQRNLKQRVANIRATTVIDRDLDGVLDGISNELQRISCFSDDRLSVDSWGDESTRTNLGEMHLRIYGEFDRLDDGAVRKLAKAQLYLGFGAEAAATLGLDVSSANEVPELIAIATLIDEPSPATPPALAGQQACDGLVAFWALLGDRKLSEDANVEAISNGLFALPAHLRSHLGPRAATYLIEAGRTDMAQIIMRRSSPNPDDDRIAAQMVRAKLSDASGNVRLEMEQLDGVISDRADPPEAPAALIELIETAWENRLGVDSETVTLAAAFAQEYQASSEGPRLQRTHVLALALNGNFDKAFGHPALKRAPGPAAENELRRKSLTLLMENAGDIAFLVHATGQSAAQISVLDPQLRIALARRLQRLGFPEQAMKYLDLPKSAGAPKAAQLLRAQSALEIGLPRRALLELSNAEGENAQRLRAEALAKSDELTSAATLYRELGEEEAAARSLWISEDWAAIPEGSSPRYLEAAHIARSLPQEPATGGTPSLSAAQSAAETVNNTRRQIENLLSVIERP
ncbi:MAG: tetratricopeptide repeat protein [Paracoccaceae bacterium]